MVESMFWKGSSAGAIFSPKSHCSGGEAGGKVWGPILDNPERSGGEGGLYGNFRRGGMDIFWNHAISFV